jgi:hypothetical protein
MSGSSTSSRQHSQGQETIMTVHDHDVLNGRGVNIAQHPGNERFRSLITTRYDENYCSSFSTIEKKALAKEIIAHIKALDPPGRFLKRSGSSSCNRGFTGPWEELTPKEVLKKTCQALRDCNRNDRSGYASAVAMPEDVKQKAEERSKSGISLKAYAADCVARAQSPTKGFKEAAFDEVFKKQGRPGTVTQTGSQYRKPAACNGVKEEQECLSPSMDDGWLKRPQDDGEPPPAHRDGVPSPHGAVSAAYMRGMFVAYPPPMPPGLPSHTAQATPTTRSHMAPVPVTNTPMHGGVSYHHPPYHTQPHPMYSMHMHSVPGQPLQHPPAMPPPSPAFHQHHQQHPQSGDHQMKNAEETSVHARMAPYSPVIWDRHEDDHDHDEGQENLDDSAEPVPMDQWKDQDEGENDAALKTAADAAAAIINGSSNQHDFTLLNGDDIPHGSSLNLNDLE